MLDTIKNYYDVEKFIDTAENMIEKYGWQNRVVHPYSLPVKVMKNISDLKDFDNCTRGSQEYLISLANGLAPIMNKWEEQEQEGKICRIKKSGKIIRLSPDMLDIFGDLVEVL